MRKGDLFMLDPFAGIWNIRGVALFCFHGLNISAGANPPLIRKAFLLFFRNSRPYVRRRVKKSPRWFHATLLNKFISMAKRERVIQQITSKTGVLHGPFCSPFYYAVSFCIPG
jgi:hypothetical protein